MEKLDSQIKNCGPHQRQILKVGFLAVKSRTVFSHDGEDEGRERGERLINVWHGKKT